MKTIHKYLYLSHNKEFSEIIKLVQLSKRLHIFILDGFTSLTLCIDLNIKVSYIIFFFFFYRIFQLMESMEYFINVI